MVSSIESNLKENHIEFKESLEMRISISQSPVMYKDHEPIDFEFKDSYDVEIAEKIGGKRMRFRINRLINDKNRHFKMCRIQIRNILSSLMGYYPLIIKYLLNAQNLRKLTVHLQSKKGLKVRKKHLAAIIIFQGRKMGLYVDEYEVREHFNFEKKGFSKILAEIKREKLFKFEKINFNHKYSAIKFSVNRLIHTVADAFNLLTRADMIQYSETSQIYRKFTNSLRKRIDKQITYFIIMKYNPSIDRDHLSEFLIHQGPLNPQEKSEYLKKTYFRMKKAQSNS
jgi:hypothetical protein